MINIMNILLILNIKYDMLFNMKSQRTYSAYSLDAMSLLGKSIRASRKSLKMSETELAERAGVSRNIVRNVESGQMSSSVGIVFELAHIVGIALFGSDKHALSQHIQQVDDKLALLPKATHKSTKVIDDDF